jgi:hypothetical protein
MEQGHCLNCEEVPISEGKTGLWEGERHEMKPLGSIYINEFIKAIGLNTVQFVLKESCSRYVT